MDAVCVVTGTDSDSSYYKTTSIQQWLFGVEITDTAILFLDKLVVFIASPKKIQFLKQVAFFLLLLSKIILTKYI